MGTGRLYEKLLAPQGSRCPPPRAHRVGLAQISSQLSHPALTPTLPGCQFTSLSAHTQSQSQTGVGQMNCLRAKPLHTCCRGQGLGATTRICMWGPRKSFGRPDCGDALLLGSVKGGGRCTSLSTEIPISIPAEEGNRQIWDKIFSLTCSRGVTSAQSKRSGSAGGRIFFGGGSIRAQDYSIPPDTYSERFSWLPRNQLPEK